MAITKQDSEKMRRLAKEGKQISKIAQENFPQYEYWEIYCEVYGNDERSARGTKRMISTCLDALIEASSKTARQSIVDELHELVWHLYNNHKSNQSKLDKIRKALGEA